MRNFFESRAAVLVVAIALGGGAAVAQSAREAVAQVPAAGSTRSTTSQKAGKPAVRFRIAADGNEARYRVREELAGLDFPNDAIGVTSAVTGGIVFDDKGRVVRDSSRFVIDVRSLKSDKARRDNFIRENTLETERYPTVTFIPSELRGLPATLPTTGSVSFQMIGDLVIRGITRPTTWTVTAQAGPTAYTGSAKTAFTFDDFHMEQPAVPIVLSVNDTIKLEYDFKLSREK